MNDDDTLIRSVRQICGHWRHIHAQDRVHAIHARNLLQLNPELLDHLDGVDGIEITVHAS